MQLAAKLAKALADVEDALGALLFLDGTLVRFGVDDCALCDQRKTWRELRMTKVSIRTVTKS